MIQLGYYKGGKNVSPILMREYYLSTRQRGQTWFYKFGGHECKLASLIQRFIIEFFIYNHY